jgi:glycosyltransferase involved in cell wall biosynthesis
LVILEAMAAGLPIIATRQGAIPDMVIDGVNGFIVPPGNPAAIAEKVVLLLKDEPLRLRMGNDSHEIFLKRFTLARWHEDMRNMFLQVSRAS